MRLYQYFSNRWSDALLDRGSLQIGTFKYYREGEYIEGITDREEGMEFVNFHINENYEYLNKTPENLKGFMRIEGECKNLTIENSGIGRTITKNMYIYCFSSEKSKKVMKTFGDNKEVCLELLYQEEFFNELNRIMLVIHKAKFIGLFECEYRDRTMDIDSKEKYTGASFAVIKDLKFKDQKEIRAIWEAEGNIEPIKINGSSLGRYFRQVDIT